MFILVNIFAQFRMSLTFSHNSRSSTRDPSSVFILLQSVYQAFDELAKKRGVFKVETIGDSYGEFPLFVAPFFNFFLTIFSVLSVAVTGLPEPQANHAVIMARFAAACLERMNHVVKTLETELGPGTGDLTMRFGVHSGPVTAGVSISLYINPTWTQSQVFCLFVVGSSRGSF